MQRHGGGFQFSLHFSEQQHFLYCAIQHPKSLIDGQTSKHSKANSTLGNTSYMYNTQQKTCSSSSSYFSRQHDNCSSSGEQFVYIAAILSCRMTATDQQKTTFGRCWCKSRQHNRQYSQFANAEKVLLFLISKLWSVFDCSCLIYFQVQNQLWSRRQYLLLPCSSYFTDYIYMPIYDMAEGKPLNAQCNSTANVSISCYLC